MRIRYVRSEGLKDEELDAKRYPYIARRIAETGVLIIANDQTLGLSDCMNKRKGGRYDATFDFSDACSAPEFTFLFRVKQGEGGQLRDLCRRGTDTWTVQYRSPGLTSHASVRPDFVGKQESDGCKRGTSD